MSVAEVLREVRNNLAPLLISVLGWTLIAPIAALVPRSRKRIVVIGRDGGKFVDNSKYFFLQARSHLPPQTQCVFLTERPAVEDMLRKEHYSVVMYPSWTGLWTLLRARILVVDSTDWYLRMRRYLSIGAKVVQLWHGVGFKRIEMDQWKNEVARKSWLSSPMLRRLRQLKWRVTGRLVRYDLVNATSDFYRQEVFERAFLSHHFIVAGYPRNAFFEASSSVKLATRMGADESLLDKAEEWRQQKRRIVLVTPTFRGSRPTPLGLDERTTSELDAWCGRNGVELVFKFHPLEKRASAVRGHHLHLHEPDSDIYPLMPLSDSMITDYSSIYMDYLLLDKPVFYLVPDMDEYVSADRQLQFDYDSMTPGPKSRTWAELRLQMELQWGGDSYSSQRAAMKKKAFDDLPQEDATVELLSFFHRQKWIDMSLPPAMTDSIK